MVAAGIGKEGSHKPSLLGRKHHIEVATKLTKNNKHPKLNKLKGEERFLNLKYSMIKMFLIDENTRT